MSNCEELYQSRVKIQPRKVSGRYQTLRNITRWLTLGVYFILPWLKWDNKNLILFDVSERKFHIFWYTFWPQDFFFLTLLLIVAALALVFITTLAGRLWCGYACPQTVWTNIFMWVEYLIEGDRNKRLRLDNSHLSIKKLAKRATTHTLWLLIAFLTALTFGGYFQPIGDLIVKVQLFHLTAWDTFWIAFFTLATYLNAGWMREQVCVYMCPYARIQSVMLDTSTLVISYDAKRGENRGSRKKTADPKALKLGDCIDCHQCVQVCPTGIDIREGLQLECIGCAACIDACDSVMDKMNYPRGLVRYATQNNLDQKPTRFLRPRLVIYGLLLISTTLLLTYLLATRIPLRLDIFRDRTTLYRETAEGLIENTYLLKVMNMSQKNHVYHIKINAPIQFNYIGKKTVFIKEGALASFPITLSIEPEKIKQRNTTVTFVIETENQLTDKVNTISRFIAPLERK